MAGLDGRPQGCRFHIGMQGMLKQSNVPGFHVDPPVIDIFAPTVRRPPDEARLGSVPFAPVAR